jgi:hypothetical protein
MASGILPSAIALSNAISVLKASLTEASHVMHFTSLTVEDEGECWETLNKETLEQHIVKVNSLIAEMKKSNPDLKCPVTLPRGRIVDRMRRASSQALPSRRYTKG